MPTPIENLTIHVGLHKCGSTWFQKTVLNDPRHNISTPWGAPARRAVSHFAAIDPLSFDAAAIRQEFETLHAKADQPAATVISEEALSSYPARGIYYADTVAERMKQTFPEARILLIFREQSSLVLSLYAQYIKTGGRRRLADFIQESEREVYWNERIVPSFFEFDKLITMYQRVFGASNVLAIPYELMRSDHAQFVGRLGAFVGVDFDDVGTGRVVNKARSAAMTELTRRTNFFIRMRPWGPPHPVAHRMRERVIPALDKHVIARLGDKRKLRHKEMIAERFNTLYAESNARTMELTGFDLAELGYVTA